MKTKINWIAWRRYADAYCKSRQTALADVESLLGELEMPSAYLEGYLQGIRDRDMAAKTWQRMGALVCKTLRNDVMRLVALENEYLVVLPNKGPEREAWLHYFFLNSPDRMTEKRAEKLGREEIVNSFLDEIKGFLGQISLKSNRRLGTEKLSPKAARIFKDADKARQAVSETFMDYKEILLAYMTVGDKKAVAQAFHLWGSRLTKDDWEPFAANHVTGYLRKVKRRASAAPKTPLSPPV